VPFFLLRFPWIGEKVRAQWEEDCTMRGFLIIGGRKEDCNWVMFTHAMNFFKDRVSLKKLILEKNSQAYSTIC
jgi:hypothetical protein